MRLNKHPSLFINNLKLLAYDKGISFSIDMTTNDRPPVSAATDARTSYRLHSIIDAPNIDASEYKELTTRRKIGHTTREDNFKVERHFWQRYLTQKEPDPKLLVEFMYGNNPINHLFSLIYMRNHHKEDNVKSAKFIEQA